MIRPQMRKQMLDVRRHLKTIKRDQFASPVVLPGIDVEFDRPAEQSPESLQHSAVEIRIVFCFQQLDQCRYAQRHANPLVGISPEIGRDIVKPGIIRNHYHLAQRAEGIHPGEKIRMLNRLAQGR